jgi:hypothetical protein
MKKLFIAMILLGTMGVHAGEFDCTNEVGYKVTVKETYYRIGGIAQISIFGPDVQVQGDSTFSQGDFDHHSYVLGSEFGGFSKLEVVVHHIKPGIGRGGRGGGDDSSGYDLISADLVYNGEDIFLYCN